MNKDIDKHTSLFLDRMYHLIRNSDISYKLNTDNISNSQEYKFEKVYLINQSLYYSTLFPEKIRNNIKEYCDVTYYTNVDIGEDKYPVKIYIYGKTIDKTEMKKYIKYIYQVLTILYEFSKEKCLNERSIHIVMMPNKKTLPKNKDDIISPFNVNSAVTTSCSKPNEVLIYRKEEWTKTLIHELVHSLGLDFSMQFSKINRETSMKIFGIKSHYGIYETYAEFMATIIHSSLVAYKFTEDYMIDREIELNTYNEYMFYSIIIINDELLFSLFQCQKILLHNNIDIKNIKSIEKYKSLYKEKTNVFCYYILKCGLLLNLSETMEWLNTNNNNIFKFNEFLYLLERSLHTMGDDNMDSLYDNNIKILKMKNNEHLNTTLRMVISDYFYI